MLPEMEPFLSEERAREVASFIYERNRRTKTIGEAYWRSEVKRRFDVVAGHAGYCIFQLLSPLIRTAIWLDSGSPTLIAINWWSPRRGEFQILKFRTLTPDVAEKEASWLEQGADLIKIKANGHPCATGVGKLLRQASLDELPQFRNVLEGSMSVVGPRGSMRHEWKKHDLANLPFSKYQRLMKQGLLHGITGLEQTFGRGDIGSFTEKIALGVIYGENASLSLDWAIFAKTIPLVLKHEGAY